MTNLKSGMVAVALLASQTEAATSVSSSPKEILRMPLIVGASVSAGYGTPSPGKRLAQRYTSDADILTIAQNGKPGREVLKGVTDSVLKDRTIIIGIDTFFWDSTQSSTKTSIAALHHLVSQASTRKIPIILGQIPQLIPGHQPGRDRLNQEIEKACRDYDQCSMLPLDKILHKVLSNGYLEVKGKRYGLSDLIPDGLHLGSVAGEYLADRLLELIEKR